MQNAWSTLSLESAIDEGYSKSRAEVLVMGKVKLPKDKHPSFIHLKMQGIDKTPHFCRIFRYNHAAIYSGGFNMKIAFQGRPGAYSEQAIRTCFPTATSVPRDSFEDILDAVRRGDSDQAMLPVENTLGGTVIPACQALFTSGLSPVQEVTLPIHHILMAPFGTGKIQFALSHPQALAQCQNYLKKHKIQAEAFYDTAGAAEELAKAPRAHTAAIASEVAAAHYGLDILDSLIEDEAFNQTRFLLVALEPEPFQEGAAYKTSLRFTLPNKPNALANVLSLFGKASLNLSKIESHPTRKAAWEYSFFLDVIGHTHDLNNVLEPLGKLTHELQCLSAYRLLKRTPVSRKISV